VHSGKFLLHGFEQSCFSVSVVYFGKFLFYGFEQFGFFVFLEKRNT